MPIDPVEFRRAVPADAPAMFAVHTASVQALCRSTYSEAALAAWFVGRSPSIYEPALAARSVIVACRGARVLGFVGAVPGEVTLLFVSPEEAGQGLGRALFELGLARASADHAGPVVVVATLNSRAFYEHYGFVVREREALVRGEPPMEIEVVRMERRA